MVAISWGGWESSSGSRLRVGIDVDQSPSSPNSGTTSVDLTWRFYVDSDSGDYGDTQTMHFGGAFGGSTTFNNNSGQILVATKHMNNVPISYGNSGSKSASARISGAYNGVTPSHSRSYNLPERPASPPNKVVGTRATEITTRGCRTIWATPANNGATLTHYQIQFLGSGGGVVADGTFAWNTAYTTVGRAPGSTYQVRVRARNAAGWGDWSNADTFTTLVDTPGTMSAPTVSNETSSGMRVSYSMPFDGGGTISDVGVYVYRGSTLVFQVLDGNGSPYDVTSGLDPATDYTVKVRAFNQAGYGEMSAGRAFSTTAAVPSGPRSVQMEALDHESVRITWQAPASDGGASLTGFDVIYDSAVTDAVTVAVGPGSRSYVATGLLPDTDWGARVRAKNAAGVGPWSTTKGEATTDPPPIVDPSLAPQVTNKTAVRFSLKGVAGSLYTREFQVATNVGFTTGVVSSVVSTQSAAFPGLPGRTYYGRYRVDSGSGWGSWSPAVTVTLPRRPVRWGTSGWTDDVKFFNGESFVSPHAAVKVWNGSGWV